MWELGQVIAALVLSVVVRCGPVRTAVNGTLVARPCLVAKGRRLAAAEWELDPASYHIGMA
jgi:hypothetical protein